MNTFCRYYNAGVCRSCDALAVNYQDQVRRKEATLRAALGPLAPAEFNPPVTSPEQGFRNKAKFVVTGEAGAPVIGLLGPDAPDEGRELLNCPLHVPEINAALPVVRDFIVRANLAPYKIAERRGELKGLILFFSPETRALYLRFVLRSKESLDRLRKHKDFLLERLPELRCLSVNLQPVHKAILEGDEEIFLTDATAIPHRVGADALEVDPRAFVQTNQRIAAELYRTAAEWVRAAGGGRFLELFCGLGAFSFSCAGAVTAGLGIEINGDAVAAANRTAIRLNLGHLTFKSADAGTVRSEIEAFSPDVVLVNPPRRGIGPAAELLLSAKPATLIYSSCNHESLAADLAKLAEAYEVRAVQLFDMFPHTSHFETLVELRRRN
jgi:23S rRNA (uracil747-C5)-methyltransferase